MQSLIKLMCFALGFYEALLGLLNPPDEEVWCLDWQFHFKAFEFMTILSSFYYHTVHTMHLPLGLPSHVTSLLPFLKSNTKNKKHQEQVTKKFSEWKQVHVGMEPSKTNQTRWEWHHNNFTPSLHLVPFCQLCTPKNSLVYSHPLNEY